MAKKGAVPIRFELPDNALIAPAPPPALPPALPPPARPAPPPPQPPPPAEVVGETPEAAASETDTVQAPDVAQPTPRRRLVWLWTLLGLIVGVPVLLTLIGAVTSPPHAKGIPAGHLVYLEADSPSEKTTTLRGLYAVVPGAPPRLLVHETEPQDVDGGVREWFTQPTISPDGTQVAFEKQFINLGEERQSVQNQIWVMPLDPSSPVKAHVVSDLTKAGLKQIVGLAWDSDSSLLFLEDGQSYSVPTDPAEAPLTTTLNLAGLTPAPTGDISATRGPSLTEAGSFAYSVQTAGGPQILVQSGGSVRVGPAASVFALSPTGDRIAFVPPGTTKLIRFFDVASGRTGPDLPVRWGWSVFGRREITSLRWSPDGQRLAFTVSKPPIPDDEIFFVDLATGRTTQLPYRAGRSAWDWGK